MRNAMLALLMASALLLAVPVTAGPAPAPGRQVPLVFEKTVGGKPVRYNYLLYLPPDYDARGGRTYPLVVFLHGMGERGNNVDLIRKHGIPKIVGRKGKASFPFIGASPQCPGTSFWTKEVAGLDAFLDALLADHAVDPKRVYLTGLSMGGYGTWAWSCARPDRFAALVPICGAGDPAKADRIKDIPTWVFHGAKDRVVKPVKSEEMVNALKAAGGKPKFTLYPDAGHDSWSVTYDNPELYTWLLKQSRN